MKCQKCGKNEVNFHYSSNVNGCVTETHLCSVCAEESGYDLEKFFSQGQLTGFGDIFGGMFPIRAMSGFMPFAMPVLQANNGLQGRVIDARQLAELLTMGQLTGMIGQGNTCTCGCGTTTTKEPSVEVDEKIKKRRELNAQMRVAVANEEFEKAAEIRDKIKELDESGRQETDIPETGGVQKCDSETTTQDSPPVQ